MFQVFTSLKEKHQAKHFDSLVRPHVEYLYRLAFYLTGAEHSAEDLVQGLLTKLYPKTAELQKIEKIRPWMVTALTNLFIDTKRQINRSPITYTDDNQALEELSFSDKHCPEKILEHEQDTNELQMVFDQLSEDHKVILSLHDIEGYTLPELVSMLSIPIGTLKSRLHRARNRLQFLLLEHSDSEEPFNLANRVNK